jgi:hypothetical protein
MDKYFEESVKYKTLLKLSLTELGKQESELDHYKHLYRKYFNRSQYFEKRYKKQKQAVKELIEQAKPLL